MEEIWKNIPKFNGYKISNCGRVKNTNNKILKPFDNGNGYKQVHLMKNGKRYVKYVHRLVAECFIANPNNLPQVNHINFNKSNNQVDNLEWVTNQENNNHYIKSEFAKNVNIKRGQILASKYYKLYVKPIEEDIVNMYNKKYTMYEIAKKYKVGNSMVCRVLKNNGIKFRTTKRDIYCYKNNKLIEIFTSYNDIVKFLRNNQNIKGKDSTIKSEIKDAITMRRNNNKKYGYLWIAKV